MWTIPFSALLGLGLHTCFSFAAHAVRSWPYTQRRERKQVLLIAWSCPPEHIETPGGLPCLRKAVEQPSRAYYMYCHDHLKRQESEDLCTLCSSASSGGPQLIEHILVTCICRYKILLTSMHSRWKEFEPRARAASQALRYQAGRCVPPFAWFNWHVR